MDQTRSEITSRVDRITGRTAQGQTNHPHRKGNRDRTNRAQANGNRAVTAVGQLTIRDVKDHKHQGECAHYLTQEIQRPIRNSWSCTEDTQLGLGIIRRIEMILIHQPNQGCPHSRTQQLRHNVSEHLIHRERATDGQANRHCRIEVRSTIGSGHHHTDKHTQCPCGRDHHPASSVSFRFRQTDVGHNTCSHQDQEHRT